MEAGLLPVEAGMTGLPSVRRDEEQAQRLGQGQPTWVKPEQCKATLGRSNQGGPPPSTFHVTTVAMFDAAGRALGLGALSIDGLLRAQPLIGLAAQSCTSKT